MKDHGRPSHAGIVSPVQCGRAFGVPLLACCAGLAVALMLGLAACGQGASSGSSSPSPAGSSPSSGGSSPSSSASAVASPAPSAPAAHPPSAGERLALAKATAIVDHPQTDEEKQHLKGYTGKDARIVGYLVQTRAAAFTVDLLVSLATQQALAAGPQFGLEPWTTAAAKGPGERWAVAMAEHALSPMIEQLAVTEASTAVCGYVVGWPAGGAMTMWIDVKGSLRGGVGIE
jgi:hypothetical protein